LEDLAEGEISEEDLMGIDEPEPAAQPAAPQEEESVELLESLEEAPATPELKDIEEVDEGMAWLESLAEKQGVSEEELLTKPEERTSVAPDWVKEDETESEAELTQIEEELEKTPRERREIDTSSSLLDLLIDEADEGELVPQPPSEHVAPPTEASLPETIDETDDAMAWLESLAEKQGVSEEELVTKPEERTGVAPDWLQTSELPPQEIAEPTQIQEEQQPTTEPDTTAEPISEEEEEIEEEIPDWLEALEATETQPSTDEVPDAVIEEDDADAWLRSLEETSPPEEPEWLPPLDEDSLVSETPTETAPSAPEWLPEADLLEEERTTPPPQQPAEAQPVPAPDDPLSLARNALRAGDIPSAVKTYAKLVKKSENLEKVISDLNEALFNHPVDISLWQTLGDAYLKADRLQEALDAYSKAEDLLR
jgi:tetratricopeptide (TPR) repeat protein